MAGHCELALNAANHSTQRFSPRSSVRFTFHGGFSTLNDFVQIYDFAPLLLNDVG
jgi:hypothetical protein